MYCVSFESEMLLWWKELERKEVVMLRIWKRLCENINDIVAIHVNAESIMHHTSSLTAMSIFLSTRWRHPQSIPSMNMLWG